MTGAERYLVRRLKDDPEYRAAYEQAKKRIGQIDGLIRALDDRRTDLLNELDELRAWKAEALEVLAAWEQVWESVGKPGRLGESKPISVLRYLEEN